MLRTSDGPWLHYGCERLLVEDWRTTLSGLCQLYEPDLADQYETALRVLINNADELLGAAVTVVDWQVPLVFTGEEP